MARLSHPRIVEVFEYGRGRQGLIPLWAGESDRATPSFICDAASRSLEAGETFYTYQRGVPELHNAIAAYMSDNYTEKLKQGAAKKDVECETCHGDPVDLAFLAKW